eukprot:959038-Pyramimonas_sp.AAC.1
MFLCAVVLLRSDVPAAKFERTGLRGISYCVYKGPQRPVPTHVRPCGIVPGGGVQVGPEGPWPPD